jgi:DNA-binding YbaB/EbfC family protein
MMRQIEKLQEQMLRTQEELGEETVTATAGGEAVTVVVNGHQEVLSVVIAPEVVDPDDVEMLQDLLVAAVNSAMEQAREMSAQRLGPLAGGLDIPGLL